MDHATPTIEPAPHKGGRKPGVWKVTTPDALIRWRAANRISRAEVAREMGVAFSAVEKWEKGITVASEELQRRLVKLMSGEPLSDDEAPVSEPTVPVAGASQGESTVLAAAAIVTEYIRQSKLSPDALVKLTRELREALR